MNNGIRGKFSDFEHFDNALKNFSDETFQVFVIDECKLMGTANKTRKKKLPDKLQYAFVFCDLGLWLGSVGLGLVGSVGSVSRVRWVFDYFTMLSLEVGASPHMAVGSTLQKSAIFQMIGPIFPN